MRSSACWAGALALEKPPPLSSWWSRGTAARPSANATTHTAITGQRNRYENLPIAANKPITSVVGERLLKDRQGYTRP